MRRALRPCARRWVEGLDAAWQVVSAGTNDSICLQGSGPHSDNAVLVIFEGKTPSAVAVQAGATVVTRAGSMPLGQGATDQFNALAKLRTRITFGLSSNQFNRGPIAAFDHRVVEKHARIEYFTSKPRDPASMLRPETVVLRHIDDLLVHCGIEFVHADDAAAIIVPTLGPALGICPAAIAAIHRGILDPSSTYRMAKVESGWRIPIGVVEAGLVARIGAAFRPGLEKVHERYDENACLKNPFRSNPRRPTALAAVSNLPKCVVKWFLAIPKDGLKNDHRRVFAGFATATNRPDEVYALAHEIRPDLSSQLSQAQKWKRSTRTCGDVLMNPSMYAKLGLVCDCGESRKRSVAESDVFTSDSLESPSSEDEKRHRFL